MDSKIIGSASCLPENFSTVTFRFSFSAFARSLLARLPRRGGLHEFVTAICDLSKIYFADIFLRARENGNIFGIHSILM